MIWTKIKLYLSLGLGLLIAALAASTKYFSAQARKEKKRANQAEKSLNHAVEVAEDDIQINQEFRSRRAAAKAEIKKKGSSDVLSDPNSNWLRDGKSNN